MPIAFRVESAGFGDALETLAGLEYRMFDLAPLAGEVARVLRDQNATARAHGLDRRGVRFDDLAASTMRKRERQGRLGPPLAPDGDVSAITRMATEIEANFPDDVTVRGTWPDAPWVDYHTRPYGTRPVRDAVGITPDGRARIAMEFDAFLAGLLA